MKRKLFNALAVVSLLLTSCRAPEKNAEDHVGPAFTSAVEIEIAATTFYAHEKTWPMSSAELKQGAAWAGIEIAGDPGIESFRQDPDGSLTMQGKVKGDLPVAIHLERPKSATTNSG